MNPRQIQHLHETLAAPTNIPRPRRHSHFWQRAQSRRNFLQTAALGAGVGLAHKAYGVPSRSAAPRPIPGGIQPFGPGTELFHVFPIAPGFELSSITDFNGVVGGAQVDGIWSGGGVSGSSLVFDTDMRFMSGEYVGQDGKHYNGAFVFV